MSTASEKFGSPARLIHWVMALLILAMLLIGIGMVSTTSDRYEMLVAIHKPLRILILVLVVVCLFVRLNMPPPATFGTINARYSGQTRSEPSADKFLRARSRLLMAQTRTQSTPFPFLTLLASIHLFAAYRLKKA